MKTCDDLDDPGGGVGVQNWPKVDDVICARSLIPCQRCVYIRHVSRIFENKFTQCMNELHTIFENLFVLCFNACYVMNEDMFIQCFKHTYTMFEDIIIQCWKTCLHKIDDISTKCLRPVTFTYLFKIVSIIENELEI